MNNNRAVPCKMKLNFIMTVLFSTLADDVLLRLDLYLCMDSRRNRIREITVNTGLPCFLLTFCLWVYVSMYKEYTTNNQFIHIHIIGHWAGYFGGILVGSIPYKYGRPSRIEIFFFTVRYSADTNWYTFSDIIDWPHLAPIFHKMDYRNPAWHGG